MELPTNSFTGLTRLAPRLTAAVASLFFALLTLLLFAPLYSAGGLTLVGECGMIDSQSDTQSSTCCFTVKTYALPRATRLASL